MEIFFILSCERWMDEAECSKYEPEWWFEDSSYEERRKAIEICNNCKVRDECLEYAITHKINHGIWGGLPNSKRKLWKKSNDFAPKEKPRPIMVGGKYV